MLANVCFDGKPPRAWTAIIRRSTSSIPEQRYANVAEFARAVRRRHAARRWGAAIAGMLVVAGVFFWLYPHGDKKQEYHEEPQAKGIVPESHVDSSITPVTNVVGTAKNLFSLGRTTYERDMFVTRIALNGKDISLPDKIKLKGKRRIEISGYGRLTASISGSRDVRLELSERATLINLTTIPYPKSGMKCVLKGPCYLNFKNLDPPEGDDIKNIWVDNYDRKGEPSFRFRGTDSYEEVRKEDKEAALDAMRKVFLPSY